MISSLSENHFEDFAALDPIYVDGVAAVFNLGPNFATMFFRWAPVKCNGGVIYERTSSHVIVQPRSSLLCRSGCSIVAMLDAQGQPQTAEPRLVAGATFN
jgi:hypothetical protein